MKKINTCYLILLYIVFTLGCQSAMDGKIEKISELEKDIYKNSEKFNNQKAAILLKEYQEFIEAYPQDSSTESYIYKAAETANSLMQYKIAIDLYNTYYQNFHDNKKAGSCLFIQAFIYENQLNDLANAERIYKQFLVEFPSHELVNDAKFSLENLGKPVEELLKQFESTQK